MKIALFCGTFDPPHQAHSQMVKNLLYQGRFDQIWYVPVGVHDQLFVKNMSSLKDRLAMLQLTLIPGTKIETFEIDSGLPSHTHNTLKALSQKYPDHQFSWLMGSDQLASLDLWSCDEHKQCFPAMASQFDFYVYPRKGYTIQMPYQNLKVVGGVRPLEFSSTLVRQLVRKGEPITNLVNLRVEQYILDHQLYT